MKLNLAIAATAVFAVSAPAFAAEKPAPTPTPAASESTPFATVGSPNKRYCYMAESTGTRIPTKICKTRGEWKDEGVIVPANL